MRVSRSQYPYLQRGRGFSTLISSLFKAVIPALKTLGGVGKAALSSPLAKSAGRTLAKAAIDGGLSLATDTISGRRSARDSAKKSIADGRAALSKIIDIEVDKRRGVESKKRKYKLKSQSKSNVKPKPTKPSKKKIKFTPVPKRRKLDLFDNDFTDSE